MGAGLLADNSIQEAMYRPMLSGANINTNPSCEELSPKGWSLNM